MANRQVPHTTKAINMRLLNQKLQTCENESTIAFAQHTGMLPSALTCPCGSYIDKFKIEEKSNGWKSADFKCHQKNCKTKFNIRKKTLFENTKLKRHPVFLLMYTFTQFLTYDKVIAEASDIPDFEFYPDTNEPHIQTVYKKVGRSTVAKYFTQFRAWICMWALEHYSETKIGGEGMTIEIDESKFGKRKYHRGRLRARRDSWVLGGLCRETGDIFLVECPGNKRDRATLIPIICKHVMPGSHIITDCWKAYLSLPNHGYTHSTVNHSKNFVHPGSGGKIHTNGIEGQWWQVKRFLPDAGRY